MSRRKMKMRGRLNTFQRTMLFWNKLKPYSAVHVVRVTSPLDIDRLTGAINHGLMSFGLADLAVDAEKKRYHYRGGECRADVRLIEKKQDMFASLAGEIREQLNAPFDMQGDFCPFRFFVLNGDGAFYLGLVYCHLIAGADSIIPLLKTITDLYRGEPSDIHERPDLYPDTYRRLLPFNLRDIAGWMLALPGDIISLRRSFRPKFRNGADDTTGFSFFSISEDQFRLLKKAVKKWGVTLNDLFLCLLLKSIGPLASKRFRSGRRKNISIASIVNIRKDLSVEQTGVFGVFLSSFRVSHEVPDDISIEDLARDVHAQTQMIKKRRIYLRAIIEKWTALALLSSLFRNRQGKFYAKYYPLWGGITNVNLDALWPEHGMKQPADYFRAVSPGQATPLVFSFTTVHDSINIGVSFRKGVFSETDIKKLTSHFLYLANNPEG